MKLAFCAECSEMKVQMAEKFAAVPSHVYSKDKQVHKAKIIDVDVEAAQAKGEAPAIYLTRVMKEAVTK